MAELDRSRQPTGVLVGAVSEFDSAVGLGVIVGSDGSSHIFHVIEIADGTRSIDVGADVSFDRLAKFGRYEASNIRVVGEL
ncbi:cold shock domain-containing protein [Ilumatobacter sp.]|jgi:cold shock CspA family protein|uniref:cold shock domain-containing protein n=1 Tax=Ilumatobacter sp. TaxID=1967498 RepID=UPI0030B49CBF|tara:strand:- start:1785 stop:2027 length:243 start_codon:yes stop_codon:yes gene_type:complete